ncbi:MULTISPECIES: MFS transporter [Ramlibacter]|nr:MULTISPECIES: MFS transporter [Ramlibacter]
MSQTTPAAPGGDPAAPLSPQTVRLMAAGAGLCVASNYFVQPLLPLLAQQFGIGASHAGFLVTVSQLGYICGLLFLVPLGDLLERRSLLVACTSLTAVFLCGMGLAPNVYMLMAASVLVGLTSVAAQVLVPMAAHLAPVARRGRVVSTVMSGLLLGILLARFASGVVAQLMGWRAVYLIAAALMALFAWMCGRRLPRVPPTATGGWRALMVSIVQLALNEPVLRRRGLVGGLSFAGFAAFWTALGFMLKDSRGAGEAAIGSVALAGVVGALSARFAGRIADRGWARLSTGGFLVVTVASWAALAAAPSSTAALVAGVIVLDLGLQGTHISNQSEIYRLDERARSRITTVYMTLYFIGGALGSALSGWAYTWRGWPAVCGLGAVLGVAAWGVWALGELRLPLAAMRHRS